MYVPKPSGGEFKGVPVLAEVFGRSSDGGHPPAEANADFIVTAVNSHAPLTECVKVLREALERLIFLQNGGPSTGEMAKNWLADAQAVLTRAKELVP